MINRNYSQIQTNNLVKENNNKSNKLYKIKSLIMNQNKD